MPQPLLQTVAELARSTLMLQGSAGVVDLLRRSSEDEMRAETSDDEVALYHHLVSRLRVCDTHLNDALHRVSKHLDAAVLTIGIRCRDYNRRNPSSRLFIFRNYCLRPSTLHLFTAREGSPYLPRVSEVGVRLHEAGLVQRALQLSRARGSGSTGPAGRSTTVQFATLGVEAVTPPLCILCGGLLVAIATLAAEVVWARGGHGQHKLKRAAHLSIMARKYSVHKDEVWPRKASLGAFFSFMYNGI